MRNSTSRAPSAPQAFAEDESRSASVLFNGIVTEYEPGDHLEIMCGRETHVFALGEDGLVTRIDPKTALGRRVRLIRELCGDTDAIERLTVSVVP